MMHDDCSYTTTKNMEHDKRTKIIIQKQNLTPNLCMKKRPQTPAPWHVLYVQSWFLKGPRPPARWPTIDKLLSNVLNLERWSCDSIVSMWDELHSHEITTYPYLNHRFQKFIFRGGRCRCLHLLDLNDRGDLPTFMSVGYYMALIAGKLSSETLPWLMANHKDPL